MQDHEFRLIFTSDEHDQTMCVAIFAIDQEGQVSMVDAWELSPFDTRTDALVGAVKAIVPLLPQRVRTLR